MAKCGERRGHDVARHEAGGLVLELGLVVVEKDVGKQHRADPEPDVQNAVRGEEVQRLRAEPASATVADTPRSASASAADNPSINRAPYDRIATSVPSRRMRPFPISRVSPRSGSVTPNPAPRG